MSSSIDGFPRSRSCILIRANAPTPGTRSRSPDRTTVDGGELVAFRRPLAMEEVERLEALRDEALIPLDAMDRWHAMAGDVALLSKPAKRFLRYERDAWRRYRESIEEVRQAATSPPPSDVPPPRRPPRHP
jgi:hypothetical protein